MTAPPLIRFVAQALPGEIAPAKLRIGDDVTVQLARQPSF
jgi:hypothetical protein